VVSTWACVPGSEVARLSNPPIYEVTYQCCDCGSQVVVIKRPSLIETSLREVYVEKTEVVVYQ
jgi:hypothetical protein